MWLRTLASAENDHSLVPYRWMYVYVSQIPDLQNASCGALYIHSPKQFLLKLVSQGKATQF